MNTQNSLLTKAKYCSNALLKGEIEHGDVPDELVPHILESFAKHEKTMKAFKNYAKGQMMNGVNYAGWFLAPGSTVRSFTKLVELHQHLKSEYGCDADTFRKNCSISTGGVKEIVKNGLPPGTPAATIEYKVNEMVEMFGETKKNAPSMKAEKKAKAA